MTAPNLWALTAEEARRAALERLQRIDPDGTYSDAASKADGREPAQLWEAMASLASLIEEPEHAQILHLLAVAVLRAPAPAAVAWQPYDHTRHRR